MRSFLSGGSVILALAAAGGLSMGAVQPQEAAATKCQKLEPNYVGSVAVSAWDAEHREKGVRVWIDPTMASVVDRSGISLRSRIANRLSRWEAPGIPRVRAVVANQKDADVSFVYGLTPPLPGKDGRTDRTLDGSFTTGAQIQLSKLDAMDYNALATLDTRQLDNVAASALHEFGHALGINGHSPSRTDLMFFDGSGEACGPACGPSKADKNTLSYLACRAVENGSGWATR